MADGKKDDMDVLAQKLSELTNSTRNLTSAPASGNAASAGGKPAVASNAATGSTSRPPEQNIVIALDGSEQSIQAVNLYLERVHRPGNRLVFVHVIELPEPKLNEARSLHMSPAVLTSMWKEEEAKVKDLEQKMKAVLKEKQIKGILRTASGKPGEVICRIAEEENAALICVGIRGMGRVRRTILGSISDFLVNHSHCPVIVCRSHTRKQSGDERTRNKSGEGGRRRHISGESIKKLLHIGGSKSDGGGKDNRLESASSESDVDAKSSDKKKGTFREEEDEEEEHKK